MPPDIELIYRRGSHYDALFGTDVPLFWLDHARRHGGPILELGCGTGRLAIPLAQAGYAVTGLDRSPFMLVDAQRKAKRQSVAVHWQESDIRSFALGQRFAWAFIANNTLCHLLTRTDFESCLACVRQHLSSGGHFLVEVFVPSLALLLQPPDTRHIFAEYDDPEGRGRVVVWETSAYDSATQIKHNRTFLEVTQLGLTHREGGPNTAALPREGWPFSLQTTLIPCDSNDSLAARTPASTG